MKWTRTIKIKDLLSDDTSTEAIKAASKGMLERLPDSAPKSRFSKALDMAESDPETALLVFNDAMNRAYDWADDNRVWMG